VASLGLAAVGAAGGSGGGASEGGYPSSDRAYATPGGFAAAEATATAAGAVLPGAACSDGRGGRGFPKPWKLQVSNGLSGEGVDAGVAWLLDRVASAER